MSHDTITREPLTLGQQLAAQRHSPRSYARSVVKRWSPMTEAERTEVAQILAPILSELTDLAGKAGR